MNDNVKVVEVFISIKDNIVEQKYCFTLEVS